MRWSFDLHGSPLDTHTTRQKVSAKLKFLYFIDVQGERTPVEVKTPLHGGGECIVDLTIFKKLSNLVIPLKLSQSHFYLKISSIF